MGSALALLEGKEVMKSLLEAKSVILGLNKLFHGRSSFLNYMLISITSVLHCCVDWLHAYHNTFFCKSK